MQENEEEFLTTLDTNMGIIRKVANSYCRNVSDRDDLVQEIASQIWFSWNKFNPEFKHSTWIYRIALNVAISFYRKSKRQPQTTSPFEALFESQLGIQNNAGVNDTVGQIYELIGEMNELNRAVMLLYLEKYSHEEISQTLGISKTNVATKVSRIKKQIISKIESQ